MYCRAFPAAGTAMSDVPSFNVAKVDPSYDTSMTTVSGSVAGDWMLMAVASAYSYFPSTTREVVAPFAMVTSAMPATKDCVPMFSSCV